MIKKGHDDLDQLEWVGMIKEMIKMGQDELDQLGWSKIMINGRQKERRCANWPEIGVGFFVFDLIG
jgi:hypothetical protein